MKKVKRLLALSLSVMMIIGVAPVSYAAERNTQVEQESDVNVPEEQDSKEQNSEAQDLQEQDAEAQDAEEQDPDVEDIDSSEVKDIKKSEKQEIDAQNEEIEEKTVESNASEASAVTQKFESAGASVPDSPNVTLAYKDASAPTGTALTTLSKNITLMQALEQIKALSAKDADNKKRVYDITLQESDDQNSYFYYVDSNYTWPEVERIQIHSNGSCGRGHMPYMLINGTSTLKSDLELKGIFTERDPVYGAASFVSSNSYKVYLAKSNFFGTYGDKDFHLKFENVYGCSYETAKIIDAGLAGTYQDFESLNKAIDPDNNYQQSDIQIQGDLTFGTFTYYNDAFSIRGEDAENHIGNFRFISSNEYSGSSENPFSLDGLYNGGHMETTIDTFTMYYKKCDTLLWMAPIGEDTTVNIGNMEVDQATSDVNTVKLRISMNTLADNEDDFNDPDFSGKYYIKPWVFNFTGDVSGIDSFSEYYDIERIAANADWRKYVADNNGTKKFEFLKFSSPEAASSVDVYSKISISDEIIQRTFLLQVDDDDACNYTVDFNQNLNFSEALGLESNSKIEGEMYTFLKNNLGIYVDGNISPAMNYFYLDDNKILYTFEREYVDNGDGTHSFGDVFAKPVYYLGDDTTLTMPRELIISDKTYLVQYYNAVISLNANVKKIIFPESNSSHTKSLLPKNTPNYNTCYNAINAFLPGGNATSNFTAFDVPQDFTSNNAGNKQFLEDGNGNLYNSVGTELICSPIKAPFSQVYEQTTTIGENAFSYKRLYNIKIRDCVTTVGANAFAGMTNLQKAVFYANGAITFEKDGSWNNAFNKTGTNRTILYGYPGSGVEEIASESGYRYCNNPAIYGTANDVSYADDISKCSATLSATKYNYTGKAITPSVTVKSGSKTLAKGTDYEVTYSNNINIGTAQVIITGIGDYAGTINKTFTIVATNYSIYFYSNISSSTGATSTMKCQTGKTYALTANAFKKTGYTFTGWNTSADGKGTTYANKASVKNLSLKSGGTVKLYGMWKKTTYSITYGGTSGASNSNPTSYNIGTSTITLKDASKKGYTFKGWYSDSKLTKQVKTINKGSVGNRTLYAKWSTNTYKITYNLNSGIQNSKNPSNYKVTSSTITLQSPSKKGYTFKGWYTTNDSKKQTSSTQVKQIAKGSTGNKTLYAKWSKNKYKIAYTLNGGTNNSGNPATYTVTSSTITLKNPSRKGYTFKGWYSDSKYKTQVKTINKGTTGNKTLYARWAANKYTIAFNGNGNKSGSMKNQVFTYNKSTALTANAYKKTGYTFIGWNTKKDGTGTTYANKASIKNLTSKANGTVTLYAKWQKTKYTISYYGANNADADVTNANPTAYYITSNTITFGKPTKTGYTFKGWYADSNFKTPIKSIAKGSTGNKKIYARWSENSYNVVFNKNGETATGSMNSMKCAYTTSYSLASNLFVKDGYVFTGWNTRADGKGTAYTDQQKVSKLIGSGTITLYAQWEERSE